MATPIIRRQKDLVSVQVEDKYIVDNYLDKTMNIGYSMVRTHLDGTHPLMKNVSSNRTYYFLNGKATFVVEGKTIKVSRGESLTIPKDTKYSFGGKFEAILIDCPAFDPKDDIIYRD